MLADVFAWNKVYRRVVLGRRRPVASPPTCATRTSRRSPGRFLAASQFDVLEDPVYLWRVRSDGSSISQQRADPRDLADRS